MAAGWTAGRAAGVLGAVAMTLAMLVMLAAIGERVTCHEVSESARAHTVAHVHLEDVGAPEATHDHASTHCGGKLHTCCALAVGVEPLMPTPVAGRWALVADTGTSRAAPPLLRPPPGTA